MDPLLQTIIVVLYVHSALHFVEAVAIVGIFVNTQRTKTRTVRERRTYDANLLRMDGLVTSLATAQTGFADQAKTTSDLLTRISEQVQAMASEARMREIVRQEVGRGVTAIGSVVTNGGGAAVGGNVEDQRLTLSQP